MRRKNYRLDFAMTVQYEILAWRWWKVCLQVSAHVLLPEGSVGRLHSCKPYVQAVYSQTVLGNTKTVMVDLKPGQRRKNLPLGSTKPLISTLFSPGTSSNMMVTQRTTMPLGV